MKIPNRRTSIILNKIPEYIAKNSSKKSYRKIGEIRASNVNFVS